MTTTKKMTFTGEVGRINKGRTLFEGVSDEVEDDRASLMGRSGSAHFGTEDRENNASASGIPR